MYLNMLKSEAELNYSNTTNALFICEKCDYQSHKTSNCGTIVTNNELKIILTEILATIKHN